MDTEQRAALDEASELNERLRQKAVGEVYQAEFDAMRDNIRQYGDYQQQKLAIASEYAEKIRKTSTEGNAGRLSGNVTVHWHPSPPQSSRVISTGRWFSGNSAACSGT